MNSLRKFGIVISSTLLVAACASGDKETPSYKPVPGNGDSSPSASVDTGNEREGAGGESAGGSTTTEQSEERPDALLASMTETDAGYYTANGNHQGAGTHFRTADGAVNCLVNSVNQFCFFEKTHDPSAIAGAGEILCDSSRSGQSHSADLYIGWNPSDEMGDPGTKPGLCQLDGGFPWQGGSSAELPSGEKLSILIDLDTRDSVECGNHEDTIICVYRDHGFAASGEEVSVW